jgi:hypothetical protein
MQHEFILWLSGKAIDENDITFSNLCVANKIKISLMLNKITKKQSLGMYRVSAYPREIIHFIGQFNQAYPGISFELFEYRNI